MRLEPCLHPLGWGSVDVGVAGLFTSVTPPSEDGKISCGSEGSSISALGFGGAVGKVVGGDSEKSNKKEFSSLKYTFFKQVISRGDVNFSRSFHS